MASRPTKHSLLPCNLLIKPSTCQYFRLIKPPLATFYVVLLMGSTVRPMFASQLLHQLPAHVSSSVPATGTHFSHLRLHTCPSEAPCVRITPPRHVSYKYGTQIINRAVGEMEEEAAAFVSVEKLRSEFVHVLRSRRSADVPLSVEPAKPVANPLYQDNTGPNSTSEAMESCPKVEIKNFKDLLMEENLYLITEEGKQGRLPVLILSMKQENREKRPAVVFLHSTNKCKEWLRPLLEDYASRGYITIAIDSRYHGERASNKTTYRDALISAWKKGDTMPFIFDTAWDLMKLADYLTQREDVDPSRIGITGESLGGMHAWFGAVADGRYTVVVPIIGVQGFRWAIDNNQWQGRVDSIRPLFEEARIDLGKREIDKEVVEKVWDRIAPGLASRFDSPYTIPSIAPRPLLIVNGADDPRCPLAGLEIPKSRSLKAYGEAHSLDKFKLIAEPGIGHQMTPYMVKEASDWFDKFLKE